MEATIKNLQTFVNNLREMLEPVIKDPAVLDKKTIDKIGRTDFSLSNLQILSFAQYLPSLFAAISDGEMSFMEYLKSDAIPNMVTDKPNDVHEAIAQLQEPTNVLTIEEQTKFWLDISGISANIRLNIFKFEPVLFRAMKYYLSYFGGVNKTLVLTQMSNFTKDDLTSSQLKPEWQWLKELGLDVSPFDPNKYSLNESEWTVLKQLPFNVFMALAAADGEVSKKEIETYKTKIANHKYSVNPLLNYLLKESLIFADSTDLSNINAGIKTLKEKQKSVNNIEDLYQYIKDSNTYVELHKLIKHAVSIVESKFEFIEIFEIKKCCLDIGFSTASLKGIKIGEKFEVDILLALLKFVDFGSKKEAVSIEIFPMLSGRERINTYGKGVLSIIGNTKLINRWLNNMNYQNFIHFLSMSYFIDAIASATPPEKMINEFSIKNDFFTLSESEKINLSKLIEEIKVITNPIQQSYNLPLTNEVSWGLFLATPYMYGMTSGKIDSVELSKHPFNGYDLDKISDEQINFNSTNQIVYNFLLSIYKTHKKDNLIKETASKLMELYCNKKIMNWALTNTTLATIHSPSNLSSEAYLFNTKSWISTYPSFVSDKYSTLPYNIAILVALASGGMIKSEASFIENLEKKLTDPSFFDHYNTPIVHPLLLEILQKGKGKYSNLIEEKYRVGRSILLLSEINKLIIDLEKELSLLDSFTIKTQLLKIAFFIGDIGFTGFKEELGVVNELIGIFGFEPHKEILGSFIISGMKKGDEKISFEGYINMVTNRNYSYCLIKSIK